MKNVLVLLVFYCMICTITCSNKISNFEISKDGHITAYNQSNTVVIPARINGIIITTIGSDAFQNKNLFSVSMPIGITSIHDNAFQGNHLTTVIIPAGVTKISRGAFSDNKLANVTIPDGVTYIGVDAFANNKLTNIIIPESVTLIGAGAFARNELNTITIGNDVEFSYDALSRHGYAPFDDFFDNFYSANGRRAGTYKYDQNSWKIDVLVQKDDYKTNGEGTLLSYTGTNSSIDIPAIIDGVPVMIIGERAFRKKGLESVIIPDSVVSIERYSFASNKLTSIIIPDSVTFIGKEAFYENELRNITIGSGVTFIEENVFTGRYLNTVTLGANVEVIYFEESNGPESSTYRRSSFEIDGNFEKFYNANGKKAGTYEHINGQWNMKGMTTLYTENFELDKKGTITDFNAHDYRWSNIIIIPTRIDNIPVTAIGEEAFFGKNLENVTIPAGVISFGEGAFRNNHLTSVIIPDSVTYIGSGAFQDNQLTTITIGRSVILQNLIEDNDYGFYADYVFDQDFDNFYNFIGKKAGTYNHNGQRWVIK